MINGHSKKRAGARATAPRLRKKKSRKLSATSRPPIEDVISGAKVQGEGPEATIQTEQSSRRRGGRPSSYRPEFAHIARALCCRGATDYELAEEFGVTTVTIWRWGARNEEFCNALKEGKDAFDDRVERSLAQRAIGTPTTRKRFSTFRAGSFVPRRSSTCRRIQGPRSCGCLTAALICGGTSARWRTRGQVAGRARLPK
jgi:hypothetical protein